MQLKVRLVTSTNKKTEKETFQYTIQPNVNYKKFNSEIRQYENTKYKSGSKIEDNCKNEILAINSIYYNCLCTYNTFMGFILII